MATIRKGTAYEPIVENYTALPLFPAIRQECGEGNPKNSPKQTIVQILFGQPSVSGYFSAFFYLTPFPQQKMYHLENDIRRDSKREFFPFFLSGNPAPP